MSVKVFRSENEKLLYYYDRQVREVERFLGEAPYVPYFYELVMDQENRPEILEEWEDENGEHYLIELSEHDKNLFPKLKNYKYYVVRVDSESDCVSGVAHLERPGTQSNRNTN